MTSYFRVTNSEISNESKASWDRWFKYCKEKKPYFTKCPECKLRIRAERPLAMYCPECGHLFSVEHSDYVDMGWRNI
jgi:Zn finger protein HypA/HybF involved in hydrogenase expression